MEERNRLRRAVCSLAAAFCVFCAPTVLADSLHLTDDSYVNFGQPNSNKGDQLELKLRDQANERRAFARFDLATLPLSTTVSDIDSATLRLWVKKVNGAGGQVDLYLVSSAWDEMTLTPSIAPTIAAAPFASLNILPEDEGRYVAVDVTAAVVTWLASNDGLALVSAGARVDFDSKEVAGTPAEIEQTSNAMIIDVALVGPAGPQGLQGVAGAIGPQGPAGNDGLPGAQGPQGSQGPAGADGAIGPQGQAGNDGSTGAQGPAGAAGVQGPSGPIGPQGPSGVVSFPANNTAGGDNALGSTTSGIRNTAIGSEALAANTTGGNNTAVGAFTLRENATSNNNTAFGAFALRGNTSGSGNTALGTSALINNLTGSSNVAVGVNALVNNSDGHSNAAVGLFAMNSNTTGFLNTAVGRGALYGNTNGGSNTAIGDNALGASISTNGNTAIGADALGQSTGANNIAVGHSAGFDLTTGANNIAIGNRGVAGEASTIRIGSASQTKTYLAGVNGNDLSATGTNVVVGPDGQLGTSSSASNVQGFYKVESVPLTFFPLNLNGTFAECDAGDMVTGGGYFMGNLSTLGHVAGFEVFRNRPSPTNLARWDVAAKNLTGGSTMTLVAYAICVDLTP